MTVRHYMAAGLLVAGLAGVGYGIREGRVIDRELLKIGGRYPQVERASEIERTLDGQIKRRDIMAPGFLEETVRLEGELRQLMSRPDFETSRRAYENAVTGMHDRNIYYSLMPSGAGVISIIIGALSLPKGRESDKETPEIPATS